MRPLVIEHRPYGAAERQSLVVEAVEVEGVAVDENHRQPTPPCRWVGFINLNVQLDAIVEPHDPRCSPQLTETKPASGCLTATQRSTDNHALSSHTGSSAHRRRHKGRTCQPGATSWVHDAGPPR
jgi:hypothetical protein